MIIAAEIIAKQVPDNISSDMALVLANQRIEKRNLGDVFLKQVTLNMPGIFNPNAATATPGSTSMTFSLANQTARSVFAAPTIANGTPSFRSLELADIPAFYTDLDKNTVNYWQQDGLGNISRAANKVLIGTSVINGSATFQVTGDSLFTGNIELRGKLYVGNVESTTGVNLIEGKYSNGTLLNIGSLRATGASYLSYALKADNTVSAGWVSSSGGALGRSAFVAAGGYLGFWALGTTTVADNTTISPTEIGRWNTTGLGVGTNNPINKLHVVDTNGILLAHTESANTSGGVRIYGRAYGSNRLTMLMYSTSQTTNILMYGGGTSGGEPATEHVFYTVEGVGNAQTGSARARLNVNGIFALYGKADDLTAIPYLSFNSLNGTRLGYVGIGSTGDNAMRIVADGAINAGIYFAPSNGTAKHRMFENGNFSINNLTDNGFGLLQLTGGSIYISTLTAGSMLKADGNKTVVSATDGTDYVSPTWISNNLASINYWIKSGSNLYYNVGNVAIGASDTSYGLLTTHKVGTGIVPHFVLNSGSATTGDGASIDFNGSSSYLGNITPSVRLAMVREGSAASGYFAIYTRNSSSQLNEWFRITSAGNIGVKTTNPLNRLHVVDDSAYMIRVERTGVGSMLIGVSSKTSNSTGDLFFDGLQASQGYAFRTRDSTNSLISALGIDRDGNVGIKTFQPVHNLHINSSNDNGIYLNRYSAIITTDANGAKYQAIYFGNDIVFGRNPGGIFSGGVSNYFFRTGTSNINRLTINSLGRVLVGNVDNTFGLLQVNGPIWTSSIDVNKLIKTDANGTLVSATDGTDYVSPTWLNSNYWVKSGNNLYYQTGNVGIGSASPLLDLDIGSLALNPPANTGTTRQGIVRIGYRSNTWAGTELNFGIINSATVNYAAWLQAQNPADLSVNRPLLLNPNGGNIGIGSQTADFLLTLSNASNATNINLIIDNTSASYQAGIRFTGKTATGYSDIAHIRAYQAANAASGALQFWTKASGENASAKIYIDENGNIGNISSMLSKAQFQHSWTNVAGVAVTGTHHFGYNGSGITYVDVKDWHFRTMAGNPSVNQYITSIYESGTMYHRGGLYVFAQYSNSTDNGYILLTGGSSTATGWVGFYKAGSTRLGYIGSGTTYLNYVAENGASHYFTGGNINLPSTKLIIGNGITDNGFGLLQLTGGSIYISTLTAGSMLKADGNKTVVSATDGTDYVSPTWLNSNYWVKSGSNLYYSSGNIGISTNNPLHKLHIVGNTFLPITYSHHFYNTDIGIGTPDSSGLQIFTQNNDTIRFGKRTTGVFSEFGRFSSYGRLLIGSVTDNGFGLLQLTGGSVYISTLTAGTLVKTDANKTLVSATASDITALLGTGTYIQNKATLASPDTVQTGNAWITGSYVAGRTGYYGTYSQTQIQGIWSISQTFKVDTTLNTLGNQYGFFYAFGNDASGAIGALPNGATNLPITDWGHQIGIAYNGILKQAWSFQNGYSWQLSHAYFGNMSQTLYSSNSFSFISPSQASYLANNLSLGKTGTAGRLNLRRTTDGIEAGSVYMDAASGLVISAFAFTGLIDFATNSATRMRITSAGRVLIGTTTENTYKVNIDAGSATADGLYVNGTIYATGVVDSMSDRRFKTDIEPVTNIAEKIAKIPVYSYRLKDGSTRRYIGVMAQDFERIFPELVSIHSGRRSFNYSGLAALVLGFVAEVKQQVDKVEKKTDTTEKNVQLLTKLVAAQKKQIKTLEQQLKLLLNPCSKP